MTRSVKKLINLMIICFLSTSFLLAGFLSANSFHTKNSCHAKSTSCASGQFFILTLPNFKTLKEFGLWLEKTQPAGVMLIPAHVKNRQQTKKLCSFLQSKAQKLGIYPLLICIDWEGGIVSRPTETGGFTSIPSPYNLAKSGAGSCFLAAQLIAQQMKEVGINIDFAPSLDLFDPKNPVLATRCFAQDPETVAQCGIEFARGLMSYGIIPVIKHYPGLMLGKGDTHFSKVQISASRKEFECNEAPFLKALQNGICAIMVSHAIYNQFGSMPASRSKNVISRLRSYNPDAVIITDDIAMQAYNPEKQADLDDKDLSNAILESINNGFDLLIYSAPPEKQIELIKKINDQISSKKTSSSVTKLKQNLLNSKKAQFSLDEKEGANELAQKALSQKINSLDFSGKNTVLISVDYTKIRPAEILINSQESKKSSPQTPLSSLFSKAKIKVREFILDPKSDQSINKLKELTKSGTFNNADYILIQTFFYGDGIWNKIQTDWLEQLKSYKNKIIIISLGHPFEKLIISPAQIIELGSFGTPMLQAAVNRLTNNGSQASKPLLTGADKLAQDPETFLKNKKFGLLCHKCSVINLDTKLATSNSEPEFLPDFLYRWTKDPIKNPNKGAKLCALFAPEHGILGTNQAGGFVKSENSSKWGCPVYSLHGATKCPSPEMLKDLDLLIIDFQEVGVRCYTYLSTLALNLQAAKDCNLPVLILERPNPIQFWGSFGPKLNPKFESFLGKVPTNFGHGSTVGQIAENLNTKIGADLTVLKCAPTSESPAAVETYFSTNFIPPSPNLPTLDSVYVYPLTVFIEGTNYSEGRGTLHPFEQIGAPWVNAEKLADSLNEKKLPGIYFEPVSFTPKTVPGKAENPKHKNSLCHGVFLHIYNRKKIKPFLTAQTILKTLFQTYPKQSEWLNSGPRYLVDLLAGDDSVRKATINSAI